MKHNRMYLAMAGVVVLVTGIAIGHLSKTERNAPSTILAKSTATTPITVNSAMGERIPVHIEGTDLTAFDYVVTVPSENNSDSQVFCFYMGFTR